MMPMPSKRSTFVFATTLLLGSLGNAGAFVPASHVVRSIVMSDTTLPIPPLARCPAVHPASPRLAPQILCWTSNDVECEQSSLNFDPLYGALWLIFLGFGVFFSPGELLDPADTKIIEGFINDPSNAQGGMNPLFFAVFNALGIMPIVMAQLALPQGRKEGVPAAPFVLGSFGAGFGALGLYLTLRAPPVETKTKAGASWITANVLDNKIANWVVVALCGSVLVTSGILSSTDGFTGVLESYQQLASTSKLVSVSSVDLMVLTIAAATLIPQDYRLRMQGGKEVDNISLIAASTVLFPVVGAALYCALRPPLPKE